MATIGSLAVNIVARTGPLVRGLKKSRSQIGNFARVGAVGLGAVTAAAYAAIRAFNGMAPEIDRISKTADRLNVSTEALSGLGFAAKLSGSNAAELAKGMTYMTRNVGEATQGAGEAAQALDLLGLKSRELERLSADEMFIRIAEAINKLPTAAQKTSAAMDIFGRSGANLLPLFNQGGAGIRSMMADAERLGITFTREQGAMVEAADDAMTRVGAAVDGLKTRLTIALSPAVEDIANKFADWVASMNDVPDAARNAGDGVSTIADVLDTIGQVFTGLRVGVTALIADIVGGFGRLYNWVVRLVNKLPGVELQEQQMTFAEELDRSVKAQQAARVKSFVAAPPSERMAGAAAAAGKGAPARRVQGTAPGGVGAQVGMGLNLAVTFGREVLQERQRLTDRADQLRELVKTPANRLMESINEARELVAKGLLGQEVLDKLISQRGAEQAQQADQLRKSVRTPMEQFRDEIYGYRQMFLGGELDSTTAQRLIDQAGSKLGGATRPRFALAQEISQSDRLFADRGNEKGKDPMREAVATAKEQLQVLTDIRDGKGKRKFTGDVIVRNQTIA